MAHNKKALIAVNLAGFTWFVMDDITILRGMGYDVTVAADNGFDEKHTLAEIERRGAKFSDIRCDSKSPLTRNNWRCFKQYRDYLKKEQFDAVICHTPIVGLIVRLASVSLRSRGCKVIYMSHGLAWTHLSDFKTKIKFRGIEDLASCFCDAIVTINNADFKEAQKLHAPKVYKIDGVGCRIERYRDITVNRKAKRKEIGIDDDKIMVLAIGEISARKNHRVIAEAIAKLPDKERYVYVICGREHGGSSISDLLRAFAEDNGVALKLLGFRNDVAELCHVADIGVIPSVREGLGMAGIQQLCAGVPMVGTAVQGIRDYIIDGITGFTVSHPDDAEGFAEKIERLSDVSLRERMRADCIHMAQKFSLQNSIAQRKAIYAEIFTDR